MIDFERAIGQIWPQWRIEKQIGRGTFGTVDQALREDAGNPAFPQRAAIKAILVPADPSEEQLFREEGMGEDDFRTYCRELADDLSGEIRMLEALRGEPHIERLDDARVDVSADGKQRLILIRTELLTPLPQYMYADHPDESEVIRLGVEMCEALDVCHRRNIIHQNVKPQSIYVDGNYSFKLGGFGGAALRAGRNTRRHVGMTFCTAPELSTGYECGPAADIYSLGMVLYLYTNGGNIPFLNSLNDLTNPTLRMEAIERRLRGEPLPAPRDASPEFAQIILKACAYKPEDRFAGAADMRDALQRLAYRGMDPGIVYQPTPPPGFAAPEQTAPIRYADDPAPRGAAAATGAAGTGKGKSKKGGKAAAAVLISLIVLSLIAAGILAGLLIKNASARGNQSGRVSAGETPNEREDERGEEREREEVLPGTENTDPEDAPLPLTEDRNLLLDEAGLLSDAERAVLRDRLNRLSERYGADVGVMSFEAMDDGYDDAVAFADDIYSRNGYGTGNRTGGILLVLVTGTRDWAVTYAGSCYRTFTEYGRDEFVVANFLPYLSHDDYFGAFGKFADCCEALIRYELEYGDPYDMGSDHDPTVFLP